MSGRSAGVWLLPLSSEQEGSQTEREIWTSRAGRVTRLPKGTKDALPVFSRVKIISLRARVHVFTHYSLRRNQGVRVTFFLNGDHGSYGRSSSYEVKPVASSTRAGFPFQVCWWMWCWTLVCALAGSWSEVWSCRPLIWEVSLCFNINAFLSLMLLLAKFTSVYIGL